MRYSMLFAPSPNRCAKCDRKISDCWCQVTKSYGEETIKCARCWEPLGSHDSVFGAVGTCRKCAMGSVITARPVDRPLTGVKTQTWRWS